MDKIKILVIEDESIVAKDIQKTLVKLGYDVPATAPSASQAFDRFKEIKPDLVLCDIRLKGDIDGIEVAEKLRSQFNTPVIFLTSYVDKATLDRAKITQPYGYIVKPFSEADLTSTIEMALYKHAKDSELRENEMRFANALQSISDAVLITNIDGQITFINPKLEVLLNINAADSLNKILKNVLTIDDTGFPMHHFDVKETFNFKRIQITINNTSEKYNLNLVVSPVRDEKHSLIGRAYVFSNEVSNADANSGRYLVDNIMLHDAFFVKKGSQLVKVPVENIFWIQAMDNYVIIQTVTDQFVIHSTMKDIETKLPIKTFVRVHRSYIINIDKIQLIDEHDVVVNDKPIPIGKSYKDGFRNRLNYL